MKKYNLNDDTHHNLYKTVNQIKNETMNSKNYTILCYSIIRKYGIPTDLNRKIFREKNKVNIIEIKNI